MSCMLVKTCCLRWRGWCTLLWSQLVHGVARLLYHLAHSPLGSLSMNDLRRQQFVLVEGVLKLSDVDDMGVSEPFCQTHADCRHHLPANLTGQSIPNYSTYNSCCNDLSFTVYYRLCNQLGVSMILNESIRDEELCFHSIVKIHSVYMQLLLTLSRFLYKHIWNILWCCQILLLTSLLCLQTRWRHPAWTDSAEDTTSVSTSGAQDSTLFASCYPCALPPPWSRRSSCYWRRTVTAPGARSASSQPLTDSSTRTLPTTPTPVSTL